MAVSSRSNMESKVAASWPTSSSVPWSPSLRSRSPLSIADAVVVIRPTVRRSRRRSRYAPVTAPTRAMTARPTTSDQDPVLIGPLLGQVGRDDDGADGAITAHHRGRDEERVRSGENGLLGPGRSRRVGEEALHRAGVQQSCRPSAAEPSATVQSHHDDLAPGEHASLQVGHRRGRDPRSTAAGQRVLKALELCGEVAVRSGQRLVVEPVHCHEGRSGQDGGEQQGQKASQPGGRAGPVARDDISRVWTH